MISAPDTAVLVAAGAGAGAVNTVAGAGSMLSWPAMLAVGVPPVQAAVANTVGLLPGSLSGLHGYRRHLTDDRRLMAALAVVAVIGASVGGGLLLVTPSRQLPTVAAVFLVLAAALVLAQPHQNRLRSTLATARPQPPSAARPATTDRHAAVMIVRPPSDPCAKRRGGTAALLGAVGAGSLYSGYFAAGLGLVVWASLSATLPAGTDIQRIHALRMWIATVITAAATVVFTVSGQVLWPVVAALGTGSLLGGRLGAWLAPRLPPGAVRWFAAAIGVLCAARQTL